MNAHNMNACNREGRPLRRSPGRWLVLPGAWLAAGVAALSGCATILPLLPESPAVATDGWSANAVRANFAHTLAPSFHAVNGVVFTYRGRTMTALGVTDADRATNSFNATCLTPSGLTIFDVGMNDGIVTTRFVVAEFNQFGDVGRAVGADIWRVHFDCLPDTHASVANTGRELRFTSFRDSGALVHVFAGADRLLVRKYWCDVSGHIVWDVRYADYRAVGEYRFPFWVRLTNYQYDYTLDVRAKQIGPPAVRVGERNG